MPFLLPRLTQQESLIGLQNAGNAGPNVHAEPARNNYRGADAHAKPQDEAANNDHGDVYRPCHYASPHNEGDAREDDGSLHAAKTMHTHILIQSTKTEWGPFISLGTHEAAQWWYATVTAPLQRSKTRCWTTHTSQGSPPSTPQHSRAQPCNGSCGVLQRANLRREALTLRPKGLASSEARAPTMAAR